MVLTLGSRPAHNHPEITHEPLVCLLFEHTLSCKLPLTAMVASRLMLTQLFPLANNFQNRKHRGYFLKEYVLTVFGQLLTRLIYLFVCLLVFSCA